jgi:zinc protease
MMHRLLRLVAGLLLAGTTAFAASPAPAFAHEASDLRADPAARFGALPNGLRYVILPNAEPKDRVSMRLVVKAGSLMETEDQRGLAHFLEHMAFNGSTHYPPGTIVEFFQRMGMGFGNDTNAYTSFDHTAYMLELPNPQDATLTEGLQVLADYAGGMLLRAEEIDKERGIITSEERARDTVGFRSLVMELQFVLPDTLLPHRLPIGRMDIVQTAPRERFVDFYDTWYRPELMTVIIVGDVNADRVEPMIAKALAPLAARGPARALPDRGQVSRFDGLRVKHHHEPEAVATTVSIQTVTPYTTEPDTAANRLKYLPRSIATAILNRRLAVLAKEENAPFSSGRTGVNEAYELVREASIELTAKPGQWAAALAVADQEIRRALEHGFQPAELREITANYRNGLEQAVKTAATRRSGGLASSLISSVVYDRVFTHPADELALYGPALASVTVEQCLAALREAWAEPSRFLIVNGNTTIEGDAVAAITAAYTASQAVAVAPPALIADAAFAYTDFGAPGAIARREHIADLDITQITFANGVRLNLKPTDFEAGRIRVSARFGSGRLIEPPAQRGLAWLAGNTFTAGGLGQHSADELRRLLAGRTVGVGFGVAADAFTLSGGTNREDLLLQLQLMAAHLTDPGYRPEALRLVRQGIEQTYRSFDHTPSGPLNTEVQNLLASGDPRFGMPPKEEMLSRNLDEVRAWLAPELAQGPMEIAVVGDLDVEATITAVARTFGALPPRGERPDLTALLQVSAPAEPFTKVYSIISEIPKGQVVLYWPTTDGRDAPLARRLGLLGDVLADRLRVKIREELGGAYSPGAASSASDTYPGYGWIYASITVDPTAAGMIADATIAIADDLQRHGVTEDELDRAKRPLLTSLRDSLRNNGYWLGSVLGRAQERPEILEWTRTRLADVESIGKPELDALAQKYLGADRVFRVTVLPEQK